MLRNLEVSILRERDLGILLTCAGSLWRLKAQAPSVDGGQICFKPSLLASGSSLACDSVSFSQWECLHLKLLHEETSQIRMGACPLQYDVILAKYIDCNLFSEHTLKC